MTSNQNILHPLKGDTQFELAFGAKHNATVWCNKTLTLDKVL